MLLRFVHIKQCRQISTHPVVTLRKVRRQSELGVHMAHYICLYKVVQLKSKLQRPEPDRLQHDRPAACVIAQQYPSVTFASQRFYLVRFFVIS